jgi:2'-5' RNA ligase
MRMFIGIGLPAECSRAIVEAVGPLKERRAAVSWVPGENLHLTLKFLGETPDDRMDEIAAILVEAAREIPPFEFVVEGAGGFPSLRAPRILWVGVRESLELVGKLHENMENALAGAGFPREGRPFHPHITVGRARGGLPPGWGEDFARAVSGKRFGVCRVASYRLYESRLSPRGASYFVLRDAPLHCEPARTEREEKGI